MRAAIIALCVGSTSVAHADTFSTVDTFGLDVSTVWEPSNGDAFGAGPLFRYETFSSKLPSWLGIAARWGMLLDSADRVFAPFGVGMMARPGLGGLYTTLEIGGTIGLVDDPLAMDDHARIDWTASATLGYRLGAWDLHATALAGGLFENAVWMFSVGRDFVQIDSTVTRSWL
jgi:hypothetical protein